MRLSSDGQHVLSAVEGVYLDGQLVMPNAGQSQGSGDLFTDGIRFFGGWDATPGLYHASWEDPLTPVWVGDFDVAHVEAFWSDGGSRWLARYTDGSRDSDGNVWTDRAACGASRQGDWLFFRTPDFAALIVRTAQGRDFTYETGPLDTACMDQGVILWANEGRPQAIGAPTPDVPWWMRIATDPSGVRWLAGYTPGWGLCLARWDLAPQGWLLSGDGLDFGPAIQARADGVITVATGETQGEFPQRVYLFNPTTQQATVGGISFTPRRVNLNEPPAPPYQVPELLHAVYVAPFKPVRPTP